MARVEIEGYLEELEEELEATSDEETREELQNLIAVLDGSNSRATQNDRDWLVAARNLDFEEMARIQELDDAEEVVYRG